MSTVLDAQQDEQYEPSHSEIIEYGKWLGMNLPDDEPLLWIARQGLKEPLPENWKACKSEKGELYYFNFSTGQSIWDHPLDEHYKQLLTSVKQQQRLKQNNQQRTPSPSEPDGATNTTRLEAQDITKSPMNYKERTVDVSRICTTDDPDTTSGSNFQTGFTVGTCTANQTEDAVKRVSKCSKVQILKSLKANATNIEGDTHTMESIPEANEDGFIPPQKNADSECFAKPNRQSCPVEECGIMAAMHVEGDSPLGATDELKSTLHTPPPSQLSSGVIPISVTPESCHKSQATNIKPSSLVTLVGEAADDMPNETLQVDLCAATNLQFKAFQVEETAPYRSMCEKYSEGLEKELLRAKEELSTSFKEQRRVLQMEFEGRVKEERARLEQQSANDIKEAQLECRRRVEHDACELQAQFCSSVVLHKEQMAAMIEVELLRASEAITHELHIATDKCSTLSSGLAKAMRSYRELLLNEYLTEYQWSKNMFCGEVQKLRQALVSAASGLSAPLHRLYPNTDSCGSIGSLENALTRRTTKCTLSPRYGPSEPLNLFVQSGGVAQEPACAMEQKQSYQPEDPATFRECEDRGSVSEAGDRGSGLGGRLGATGLQREIQIPVEWAYSAEQGADAVARTTSHSVVEGSPCASRSPLESQHSAGYRSHSTALLEPRLYTPFLRDSDEFRKRSTVGMNVSPTADTSAKAANVPGNALCVAEVDQQGLFSPLRRGGKCNVMGNDRVAVHGPPFLEQNKLWVKNSLAIGGDSERGSPSISSPMMLQSDTHNDLRAAVTAIVVELLQASPPNTAHSVPSPVYSIPQGSKGLTCSGTTPKGPHHPLSTMSAMCSSQSAQTRQPILSSSAVCEDWTPGCVDRGFQGGEYAPDTQLHGREEVADLESVSCCHGDRHATAAHMDGGPLPKCSLWRGPSGRSSAGAALHSFSEHRAIIAGEISRLQQVRWVTQSQRRSLEESHSRLQAAQKQWKQDILSAKAEGVSANSSRGRELRRKRRSLNRQAADYSRDKAAVHVAEQWVTSKEQRLRALYSELMKVNARHGQGGCCGCAIVEESIETAELLGAYLGRSSISARTLSHYVDCGSRKDAAQSYPNPQLSRALGRIEKRLSEVTNMIQPHRKDSNRQRSISKGTPSVAPLSTVEENRCRSRHGVGSAKAVRRRASQPPHFFSEPSHRNLSYLDPWSTMAS